MTRPTLALLCALLVAAGLEAQTRVTVIPGRLEVRGAGASTVNASTNATHSLQIRNSSSGSAALSALFIGTDTSATQLTLQALSSTHASGPGFSILSSSGTDGLIVRTDNAEALFFGTNGSSRGGFTASGNFWVGSTNDQYQSYQTGTFTPATANTAAGYRLDTSIAAQVNSNAFGIVISPTLVEAASGTHGILASAIINTPTVTAGAAGVTTAATLYVNGAPSASGAANYALIVSAGQSAFPDGTAASPALTFASDSNTGLYSVSADVLGVAISGVKAYEFFGGAAVPPNFNLSSGAYGVGSVGGGAVFIGRNSSTTGAPGTLGLELRTGGFHTIWIDTTGLVRTTNAVPTVGTSDTIGTIVGTQASTWESKEILGVVTDRGAALAEILRTPVYRFRYKSGAFNGETFTGITTRTSPRFGMDQGKSFNPVTAFGVTVLAVQELERRVRELEARR